MQRSNLSFLNKSTKHCQNLFALRSKIEQNQQKQILVDYSPVYSDALGCMLNTVPIFNNDGEPCQPGFIIKAEQPMLLANMDHYRNQFRSKIREVSQKIGTLYVPRPKASQLYCNVCKDHFKDYLQHVESKIHKLKFKKNSSIQRISCIADEMQRKQSITQSALNSLAQPLNCGLNPYEPNFDDSNYQVEFDSTQCEPHRVKKVKPSDSVIVEKMGNSSSFNLELSCQVHLQKTVCLGNTQEQCL